MRRLCRSVLDFGVKIRISPLQLRKVGAIIKNMQSFEEIAFTRDQINDVIRALFVDDSEENLGLAFAVFDADASGYLDTQEFVKTVKLIGEDLPEKEILALFEEIDVDKSGTIEIDEFSQMMKQLGLRLNVSKTDQIMTCMSVLDFGIKIRISPLKLRKVGAIIQNMQHFEEIDFTDQDINEYALPVVHFACLAKMPGSSH